MQRSLLPLAVCLLMLGAIGCTPDIGDDCSSSTDCSLRGDRLCDTTQPGGYCTVFNCEPNNCPEEAQCVAFNSQLDPVCEAQGSPRFQRTFCMKRCGGNGDCRGGYVCLDTSQQPNAWGAIVVDTSPEGVKICVANSPEQIPSGGNTDLCGPFDGSFPDVSYYEPDVLENLDVVSSEPAEDVDAAEEADAFGDVVVEAEADAGVDAADASDASLELDAADAEADAEAGAEESGADGGEDVEAEATTD